MFDFFSQRIRKPVDQDDIRLVQDIITALRSIQFSSSKRSFSISEDKFTEALITLLSNTYQLYWVSECKSPLYRALREKRAAWKYVPLENGPEIAQARMWRGHWGVLGDKEGQDERVRNALIKEFQESIVIPLQRAQETRIARGSRLDYLVDGLKRAVKDGWVYSSPADILEETTGAAL